MEKTGHDYWKEESRYNVVYNDIEYIREECKMLDGFHIIKWNIAIEDESMREDGPLYYYSFPRGWSDKTKHLNPNQSPPDLEIIYQGL
jgi:hypothetical protein